MSASDTRPSTYEGCPHGLPPDQPCEDCRAIYRAHIKEQEGLAYLEELRRQKGKRWT